jgi:pectin methylesterase-like acyl-CoA thioesterase
MAARARRGPAIRAFPSKGALMRRAMLITVLACLHAAGARAVCWTVEQDGSGDFTTIQAAIDAAPADATQPFVILIRSGTYREQVFIEKPFLALVGEERDSTRIVFALLRETWRQTHPDGRHGWVPRECLQAV